MSDAREQAKRLRGRSAYYQFSSDFTHELDTAADLIESLADRLLESKRLLNRAKSNCNQCEDFYICDSCLKIIKFLKEGSDNA